MKSPQTPAVTITQLSDGKRLFPFHILFLFFRCGQHFVLSFVDLVFCEILVQSTWIVVKIEHSGVCARERKKLTSVGYFIPIFYIYYITNIRTLSNDTHRIIIHWNTTSNFDYNYIVKMYSFNAVSLFLNHSAPSWVNFHRVEPKTFHFGYYWCYMVNSLVCGDMYKIPKVAPMVEMMKIHKRNLFVSSQKAKRKSISFPIINQLGLEVERTANLSITRATCCHSSLMASLRSCSANRISLRSIFWYTLFNTRRNCRSKLLVEELFLKARSWLFAHLNSITITFVSFWNELSQTYRCGTLLPLFSVVFKLSTSTLNGSFAPNRDPWRPSKTKAQKNEHETKKNPLVFLLLYCIYSLECLTPKTCWSSFQVAVRDLVLLNPFFINLKILFKSISHTWNWIR